MYRKEAQELSFSVVVTTYNRERLIARAIDSVLAQSHAPREIIIVDDGSTDGTRAVVGKYGERVRYIYQENAGISAARNTGVAAAGSDWIAFLDDDDIWDKGYLARMAAAIVATNGIANYYFADTVQEESYGRATIWQYAGLDIDTNYELRHDGTEWVLMDNQPMRVQSAVFKRSAYLKLGGSAEDVPVRTDTYLFLNLGLAQPVCAVAGNGAIMSDHAHNRLTAKKGEIWASSRVTLYRNLLQQKQTLPPETVQALRMRLADAYWTLAAHARQRQNLAESAKLLTESIKTSPAHLLNKVREKL